MHVPKNGTLTNAFRKRSGERGFSLPDICIVITIGLILAVIATPQTIRQLQLHRLDKNTALVGDKLSEARMNAIKRNRTTWLRLDRDLRTAQIQTTNAANATINIGAPVRLPQGVNFNLQNSLEISFDSMGRLSSGTSSFSMRESNSNKTKAVSVSQSGKISIGNIY